MLGHYVSGAVRLAGAGYLLAVEITQLWRSRAGNSERAAHRPTLQRVTGVTSIGLGIRVAAER